MNDNKKFLTISTLAIFIVSSLTIISFFAGEPAENYITGKTLSKVYIIETPPAICTKYLGTGLNMISFYCELGIDSINKTLVDINNNTLDFNSIFTYETLDVTDPWKSYNPSLPNYTTQQIETVNRRKGYWVKMNAPGTYYKEGLDFIETDIEIKGGWNFISYPTSTARNISQALNQLNESYNYVESYQEINGTKTWVYFNPLTGGTLTMMKPLEAYWLNATANETWTVNW